MFRVTGKGPNILAADVSLQASRDRLREAISVQLTEPAASRAVWTVTVEVHTRGGGVFVVGRFKTRPPKSGDPSSRVVVNCFIPGAVGWKLYLYGPNKSPAQIQISSGRHSVAGVFGMVPVNGTRVSRETWDQPASPIVMAQQGILTPGPGTLEGLYGFTDPATPAGFFGLVDKATPVVNGDVWRVAPVPIGGLGVTDKLSFNFHPDGVDFANQARWVLSSTLGIVTLLGAGGAVVQGDRI